MIGSFNKAYNRPIIVDEGQLRYLSNIIIERFDKVEYEIHTVDGASYKLPTIDDVIAYSNPDSRRIIKINIWGEKKKDSPSFYWAFSLSLFDMSKYDSSCILTMKDLEDTEITFLAQRIDEFVKGCQFPCWWIHSKAFYIVLGFLLYAAIVVAYYVNLGHEKWVEMPNKSTILTGWSVLCMLFSVFVLGKSVDYLFPEGGFSTGEQVKYMKKKNKARNLVFNFILGTIILGVISGLITHYITG